ncbi:MAG: DUF669 domain-containing protein [Phycisphaeraceae bacterium]
MAHLDGFDARQVDPATSLDPLPAGKYVAVVSDSQMKPTKNANGSYLELTFDVIEGEHKGRKAWARLNLHNPSEAAVKIARAELSAICRAVGVMQPRDSVELHNLPLVIAVKLKRREDTGELANEIKGYEAKPKATTPPAERHNDTPVWKR